MSSILGLYAGNAVADLTQICFPTVSPEGTRMFRRILAVLRRGVVNYKIATRPVGASYVPTETINS
ncbi:hypothetical protein QUB32_12200 [Microcoleus sp. AT8-A4]|uniref:hypothetical protein n=1 Tax=unclassified Microcoleus TaxID=2642155 RepID=UPI002FD20516